MCCYYTHIYLEYNMNCLTTDHPSSSTCITRSLPKGCSKSSKATKGGNDTTPCIIELESYCSHLTQLATILCVQRQHGIDNAHLYPSKRHDPLWIFMWTTRCWDSKKKKLNTSLCIIIIHCHNKVLCVNLGIDELFFFQKLPSMHHFIRLLCIDNQKLKFHAQLKGGRLYCLLTCMLNSYNIVPFS